VLSNGLGRDEEHSGDLGVPRAASDPAEHLRFTWCEPHVVSIRLRDSDDHPFVALAAYGDERVAAAVSI
jgi:hypothetical protein